LQSIPFAVAWTQKAHQKISETPHRATRRQPKTLDLGLAPIEGGQPSLHVTEPGQIGVGRFLTQRPLGILELSI
jgi:hypothetical protein